MLWCGCDTDCGVIGYGTRNYTTTGITWFTWGLFLAAYSGGGAMYIVYSFKSHSQAPFDPTWFDAL